jgi:hypothetical protein
MPSGPELLLELGRVAWAAARLHDGVRDAINRHHSTPSDEPFKATLGQAIAALEMLAEARVRPDQLSWISQTGRPASRRRNAVIHAVTFTAQDGKQAIGTLDHSSLWPVSRIRPPGRNPRTHFGAHDPPRLAII